MKCAITRQDYYKGDKVVTLTASVTSNGVTKKRDFKVFIKSADLTDEQSVAEDKKYLDANMPSNVDKNIDLMKENPLPYGSTVKWTSNKEESVNTDGTVVRPDFGFPTEAVELTASLTKGDASDTATYNVNVMPVTTEDALSLAVGKVTWNLIKNKNTLQNRVMTDLTLPSTIDDIPVVWETSVVGHPEKDNVTISKTGVVTRPEYNEKDLNCSVTAYLSKDSKSASATIYDIIVVKKTPTSQQRCDMYVNDSENILRYITKNGEGANTSMKEIKESFSLPALSDDIVVEWSLVQQNGEPASPNSYIKIDYKEGVPNSDIENKYDVTITRPSGSNITTYLKVVAKIEEQQSDSEDTIPGGEATKIYEICILDSNEDDE